MATAKTTSEARLKIGAVANLTGLSAHNLRKWEERYGAVTPQRTGSGERLYTREDVRRLVLIRRLSSAGVPIGEVAKASLAELEEISKTTLSEQREAGAGLEKPQSIRVVIIGEVVAALGGPAASDEPEIDVVLRCGALSEAVEKLSGQSVDIVMLETPTVHDGTEQLVSDAVSMLDARGTIVVYGFGARAALESLRRSGVLTMRAPIDSSELRRAAVDLMSQHPGALEQTKRTEEKEPPPPRFSHDMVSRIVALSPSIKCECPHHLAQIIMNLRAFEQYCGECENSSPSDAELHHYLKRVTGGARAAFEEALARVAETEGIYVSD